MSTKIEIHCHTHVYKQNHHLQNWQTQNHIKSISIP